jgi:hypothetical protein
MTRICGVFAVGVTGTPREKSASGAGGRRADGRPRNRRLKQNSQPRRAGYSSNCVRRCPTLPQGPPCSTIGAESLSFRVRNVTGRFPLAMAAETLLICIKKVSRSVTSVSILPAVLVGVEQVGFCSRFPTVDQEPHSGRGHTHHRAFARQKVLSIYRLISTGQLHESLVLASTSRLSTQ